jgi:membrane-bound ClpP family serine protease
MRQKRKPGGRSHGTRLSIAWTSLALLFCGGRGDAGQGPTSPQVLVITISGGINSGSEDYIREGIDRAEKDAASCLVLELDTPGGGLKETQNIVKRMLQARVPVVV